MARRQPSHSSREEDKQRYLRGECDPRKESEDKGAAKRTHRVTRSQSRGLDGQDNPSSNRRGRSPSIELGDAKKKGGAENSRGSGATKRKRQNSTADELPTLSEEPSQKSPRRDSGNTIPETIEIQQFAPELADDYANISGTTILGNDSFDASENLDLSLMLEVLPELLQSSTNLLEFLVPSKLPEEKLAEWTSRLQQGKLSAREKNRLSHRVSVFETNKKCFGSQSYIDISSITRAFAFNADVYIHDLKPMLENVLQKANLASLAAGVTAATEGHSSEKLLLELRSSFPLPFMLPSAHQTNEELTNAEESFLQLTFDLGLDIRTQSLIRSLASQNVENSLASDTPQNKGIRPGSAHHRLVEEYFEDRDSILLPDNHRDRLQQRTGIIRNSLRENVESSLNQLRETFFWNAFVVQLFVWIQLRVVKINSWLSSQDSLEDMVDRLQEILGNQKVTEKSSEPSQPLQQQHKDDKADELVINGEVDGHDMNGEGVPRSSPHLSDSEISQRRTYNWDMLNRSSMRLLKRRENKEDNPSQETVLETAEQDRSRKDTSPADSWETCADTSEPETKPGRSVRKIPHGASEKRKQFRANGRTPSAAARNLGSAFIDPQEDAQRVSPISLEDSAQRRKHKRPLRELSDVDEARDDSESEAYQRDERRVDIERNRKRKPKGSSPPRKRRALEDNSLNGIGPHHNGRAREPTASSHPDRQSVSSSQSDDSVDERAQSEEPKGYVRAQQERQPAATRIKERKPQTRRKWSHNEVNRLIKLVGKVGTSWSLIKQEDEAYAGRGRESKLTERNQVQLKDKARNMVVDFYKSHRPLPKNFDQVHISQKQVEQLAQLGIEYP